jgi:putative phosphoribosyl transferase
MNAPVRDGREVTQRTVAIVADSTTLPGDLRVPTGARALTIFAHGSGSSRASPRNVEVADALNQRGIATLLFDLLSEGEARDRANVFDVPLLADRLCAAVRWAGEEPASRSLAIALFGASTGAE